MALNILKLLIGDNIKYFKFPNFKIIYNRELNQNDCSFYFSGKMIRFKIEVFKIVNCDKIN